MTLACAGKPNGKIEDVFLNDLKETTPKNSMITYVTFRRPFLKKISTEQKKIFAKIEELAATMHALSFENVTRAYAEITELRAKIFHSPTLSERFKKMFGRTKEDET